VSRTGHLYLCLLVLDCEPNALPLRLSKNDQVFSAICWPTPPPPDKPRSEVMATTRPQSALRSVYCLIGFSRIPLSTSPPKINSEGLYSLVLLWERFPTIIEVLSAIKPSHCLIDFCSCPPMEPCATLLKKVSKKTELLF
jgi:hypothetical protein